MPNSLLRNISVCILTLLLVSGCSLVQRFQPTPTPTPIPTPVYTATPQIQRVLLVAPDSLDDNLVSEAQAMLAELAGSSGLQLETLTQIQEKDLTSDVSIVVFLQHPENLGTLANSAPQTQFAVVSNLNWNPTGNITIIRERPEYVAFLAGFISVILDNNFRGGALMTSENTLGQQAFLNGGYYYCGLCAPNIPPYSKYPYTAVQPANSPAINWQTAFDQMNINLIRALYVSPEAYSDELFQYLTTKDLILFGSQTPLQSARSRWAVTLQLDGISPLREIWPDLIASQGGKTVYGGLRFSDVQPALIGQGKLEYAQRILEKLRAGMINPLDVALD
jgi:hypothetical protein